MALTEIEKKLVDRMIADGKTKEEIPGLLAKAKEKLGLSGGSFMTRAASMVETAPKVSPELEQKATAVKEQFPQIDENIKAQSKIDEIKPSLGESVLTAVGGPVLGAAPEILTDAYQSAKTLGGGLLKQAETAAPIASAITGNLQPLMDELKQPPTDKGTGLKETVQGAMGIAGSPVTGFLKDQLGEEKANAVMEVINAPFDWATDKTFTTWAKSQGIDTTTPEFQESRDQFVTALQLFSTIAAPKVTDITGKGLNWGGKRLKGAGRTLNEKVLPTTIREAEMLQKFDAGATGTRPRTIGETAVERGISGTQTGIGTKATATKSKIFTEEIKPALKGSSEVITRDELFKPLEEKISKTLEPGRKAELKSALDAIKDEYADAKFDKLTLEDAQVIKSGLDEFTPQKSFKGQEISNAYNQLRADMANNIRQQTYNKLSDIGIKAKYLDYTNLLELEKLGIKARTQKGIGFKPGGTDTLIRDLWDMAAIPLGTTAGKWLYKIGDFLEFESPKPVKTVGEYIKEQGITKPEFESVVNKE